MKRLLLVCLLLGCGKHTDRAVAEAPAPMAAKPEVAATAASGPPSAPDQLARAVGQTPRKIVRTGELRVVVEGFEAARERLDAIVGEAGGFIADLTVTHRDRSVSAATFTLRIPSARFDDVVAKLRPLGEVQDERTQAEDISESYYDMESRLKNARILEARVIDLVKNHSGPIADLLQIERELGRIREEIERMDGRIRSWDNLLAMSTLRVTLDTRVAYVAAAPVGLGDRVASRWSASLEGVGNFFANLLLGAVELVPWLPLLAAPVVLFIWYRKRRQARVKRSAPAAA
jgi:hypothetical protein